jgi:hypothetical protein
VTDLGGDSIAIDVDDATGPIRLCPKVTRQTLGRV